MTLVIAPLNDSRKNLLIKLAQEPPLKVEVFEDENIEAKNLRKQA